MELLLILLVPLAVLGYLWWAAGKTGDEIKPEDSSEEYPPKSFNPHRTEGFGWMDRFAEEHDLEFEKLSMLHIIATDEAVYEVWNVDADREITGIAVMVERNGEEIPEVKNYIWEMSSELSGGVSFHSHVKGVLNKLRSYIRDRGEKIDLDKRVLSN